MQIYFPRRLCSYLWRVPILVDGTVFCIKSRNVVFRTTTIFFCIVIIWMHKHMSLKINYCNTKINKNKKSDSHFNIKIYTQYYLSYLNNLSTNIILVLKCIIVIITTTNNNNKGQINCHDNCQDKVKNLYDPKIRLYFLFLCNISFSNSFF